MRTTYPLTVLVLSLLVGVRSSMTPLSRLIVANDEFALRLYKRVVDIVEDDNVLLSPFSISTALTMTYAGARGKTAAEMRKALGFDKYQVVESTLHKDFHRMLQHVNNSNDDNDNCTLVMFKRLFPDKRFKLLSTFVDLAAENYVAAPETLDFAGAADEARRYINKWVADATEQKIKDLLSSRDITPETALVLASAIYFKASWLTPFDKSKSTIRPFYVAADLAVNITMMQITGKFRYYRNSELKCQFVELPYVGNRLSMILVVPQEKDGLSALESNLTSNAFAFAVNNMKETTVTVKMPKFSITQRFDLVQTLNNMGIHDLFKSGSADLSGLAEDSKGLAVSGVVHKAYISVNEEGTEAAAATAVITTRARPMEVVADRPFVFLVRDNMRTGISLFVGRLIKPPKDDDVFSNPSTTETTDNSPSTAGHTAPVSVVACLVSLALLLFVGHAF